jgi:hypothetical protein
LGKDFGHLNAGCFVDLCGGYGANGIVLQIRANSVLNTVGRKTPLIQNRNQHHEKFIPTNCTGRRSGSLRHRS